MEINIFDINGKQIKEGQQVRVLYTDWIDKNRDSKYGIVKWFSEQARYLIQFDSIDKYGFSETGDFNIGPHGEIEIIS